MLSCGTDWVRFKLSKTNYNVEVFKLTIYGFQGFIESTAENTYRDICRFPGVLSLMTSLVMIFPTLWCQSIKVD